MSSIILGMGWGEFFTNYAQVAIVVLTIAGFLLVIEMVDW